jgi:hypothetical protein
MVPFLVLILVLTLWVAASYLQWRAIWWAWINGHRLLARLPSWLQSAIGFVCLIAFTALVLLVWFSAIANAIAAAQSGDPLPVIGWALVFGGISVLSYNLIALWCRGDDSIYPRTNWELSEPTRGSKRQVGPGLATFYAAIRLNFMYICY